MNHHTREARRRGASAAGGRVPVLAAAAVLLAMVTGCAGQPSGLTPGRGSPPRSGARGGGYGYVSPADESRGAVGQSGISGGALFGGNNSLAPEQGELGRRLAIVRVFFRLGQHFPGARNSQLMADGSTLLVSLDSNGANYASIAAGNHDAAIRAFLESVNQAAVLYRLGAIYICFEHEPDNSRHHPLGSPSQFIRAWHHVHRLAESAHLGWNQGGRLHWVWILTHSAFATGRASSFWPGAGEVDVVGADGYNSSACKVARSDGMRSSSADHAVTPAAVFDPAIGFAVAHGKRPLFISEWGSVPAPSGAQPAFIRQMESFVAANREIAAVMYWDSNGKNCRYSVNSSPASIAALAAMGHSFALQGRVAGPG